MQSARRDIVATRRQDPADKLSSHESLTQENPQGTPPHSRRHAHQWMIQYHDVWSRLTLSSFYEILDDEEDLKPNQYARWLLDCSSISMSLVEAATRAAAILRISTSFDQLPLLTTATQNATFLTQYTVSKGFDINSNYRLSHPAQRLVDLIEASTAPDAPPAVALTACWVCMYSSWQAWALCRRRRQTNPIPLRFREIAEFISRNDAISELVFSKQILDTLLNTACSQQEYEKAGKTFEEIAKRSCAVLDHTIFMGESNHVPLCTCGRKGHFPSECTFKSHI